jgi:hypothetical protein
MIKIKAPEAVVKNIHIKHIKVGAFACLLLVSVTFAAFSQTLGDVDSSGNIDIVDALIIAQYYVGMDPPSFNRAAADVDGNGNADIVDALLVAQYYVGIILKFPGDGSGGSCGTCVGYSTYPYCCNPATADPDGDGWGWENNANCIVKGSQVEYDQACDCPTPFVCPNTAKCSCYHVEGLGENKKKLTAAGGTRYDMAAAMMETENMSADYIYGDGKTQDAANFGVCKQNWGMIRQAHPAWRNLGPADYRTGEILNTDRALDMTVLHESQEYFGSLWWAGHRNGSTGLANPDTDDIRNFKAVMDWTDEQLGRDPMYMTNNVRFAVDVGAI